MALDLEKHAESPASSSSASLSPFTNPTSPVTTPDDSDRSENNDQFPTLDGSCAPHHGLSGVLGVTAALQFILVIGGLGYIGSHTSLELLKAGFNVIIVDNLTNSYEDVFYRIKKLADDHYSAQGEPAPLLHFHKLDYRSRSMRFLLESYADVIPSPISSDISLGSPTLGVDANTRQCRLSYQSRIVGVIHFAASKSVVDSISRPLHYYRNNVCGLVTLLELLERYGIRSFVFSSSATVYGSSAERGNPLREEDLVHHPELLSDPSGKPVLVQPKVEGLTSPYARTKYFSEAILADVAAVDRLWRIIALRYFNPVGSEPTGLLGERPRSQATNLFPVLTQVLAGGRPVLDIFGSDYATVDGTPMRDFVHVVDVARGHIAALRLLLSHDECHREPFRAYNLGSGIGTTVLEAVRSLEAASGKVIPVRWSGRRSGDVGFCVASNDRAKRELHWTPQESLERCATDSWNFVRRNTLPPEVKVSEAGKVTHPPAVTLPVFGRSLCVEPVEIGDALYRAPALSQETLACLAVADPNQIPLPPSPIVEPAEEISLPHLFVEAVIALMPLSAPALEIAS